MSIYKGSTSTPNAFNGCSWVSSKENILDRSLATIAQCLRGQKVIVLGFHAEIPGSFPESEEISVQPTFISLEV